MKKILFVLFLAALFAGCAKRAVIVPEKHIPIEPVVIKEIDTDKEIFGFLTVNFDFDRYEIRPDMQQAIEHNVYLLKKYPQLNIRIEGHCDERGTEEYNQILGEKRAQAVKEVFESCGISSSRIKTISYGECRPLLLDYNEEAWAENRRAETNSIVKGTDDLGGWFEIWDIIK